MFTSQSKLVICFSFSKNQQTFTYSLERETALQGESSPEATVKRILFVVSNVAIEQLVRLKDHGVSASYIRRMKEKGYDISLDEYVRLRVRGEREE